MDASEEHDREQEQPSAQPTQDAKEHCILWRVQKLRLLQRACGLDLQHLNSQQMGFDTPPVLHHIFRVFTGKGGAARFRVRICRSCNKGDFLIEMGTYPDRESAILVNDCHEILQGRIEKLHCLTPGDAPFFEHITVAGGMKRGHLQEKGVLAVVQERLKIHEDKIRADEMAASSLPQQSSMHSIPPLHVNIDAHATLPSLGPLRTNHSSLLPGLQQSIPFLSNCCASLSSALVKHGLSKSIVECETSLHRLTHTLLTAFDRNTEVIEALPTFTVFLLRSVFSSYAPIKDAFTLCQIMEPLEKETQKRLLKMKVGDQVEMYLLGAKLGVEHSSADVQMLCRSLMRYAFQSVTFSLCSLHNIKFPRHFCHNNAIMDRLARQMLLKGTADWDLGQVHFLCDMVDTIEESMASSRCPPGENFDTLKQLIHQIRLFASWVMGVGLGCAIVLYDLNEDRQVLLQMKAALQMFEHHYNILSPDMSWIHHQKQLDVLLLLFDKDRTLAQPNLHLRLGPIAELYSSVLSVVRRMPDFWEARTAADTFLPVMIDPLMPTAMLSHEWSLRLVTSVTHALVTMPELYDGASQSNLAELFDQLQKLLRVLSASISSLHECVAQTGCGFFSPYSYHCLYVICKHFGSHVLDVRLAMVSDLLKAVLNLAQELLKQLSHRFILALDLLQVLETDSSTPHPLSGTSSSSADSDSRKEEQSSSHMTTSSAFQTCRNTIVQTGI